MTTTEDDESTATLRLVGRQIKLWREAARRTQAELGATLGYSEETISALERGRRVPKPEFLQRADEVLGAGGHLVVMKKDVEEAQYPKNTRNLAKVEADSVEMGAYYTHNIHALLQTEEHMRAIYRMRRPVLTEEIIERDVAARMARQRIINADSPSPVMSFVMEEVALRRPVGGRAVHRRQLEHLMNIDELHNITIQVMPTSTEYHPGLGGSFRLFKLNSGTTLGYTEVQQLKRFFSAPKEVQSLEMQYGNIRAEALRPGESRAFVEKLLGET
ncbi:MULTISPECIES: helix-turn-helix transcriptional regulator [unclassified Streptomyces]|uniref:helix-turn-helix domain-containing protein n=1 Tax=unclassified Streptomyces TaxID=2593676 RepID=UPI00278C121E|nr:MULTISPECIES: helix-turn-helix transcriptional regulator [unclassified Streptomyces]